MAAAPIVEAAMVAAAVVAAAVVAAAAAVRAATIAIAKTHNSETPWYRVMRHTIFLKLGSSRQRL